MAATPLPALIGLHAIRLLGVTFIILYAEGRLPAPFAPSAGWGDMFIGATALPLAWAVMRFGARVRPLVLLWNALGVADLVIALTLGPFRRRVRFRFSLDRRTASPMTTLPWLIIPGFLVPILLFIHVVIFTRLLRQDANLQARHCVARRSTARRSRPETSGAGACAPASEVDLGTGELASFAK